VALVAFQLLVGLLERYVLAPLLALVLQQEIARRPQGILEALRWAVALVWQRLVGGNTNGMSLLSGSGAVALAAFMILLAVAPVVLTAWAFARRAEGLVSEELRARDEELRQAYERRNLMISDMAHDLRTPVMSIAGFAQALDDGVVRSEEDRARYLHTIRTKSDQISRLVTMLFDFVKLESEGYKLSREQVDLPQLLLTEAAAAYDDIEAAGMTLSVHVPEEPLAIQADRAQLSRAVQNLLTNAVRHNPAGTTVELAMGRRAGVADIVVADSGTQITQTSEELFVPFTRGDAARSGEGSGLGLSIVADIVKLHGYQIELLQPYGAYTKAFVITCALDNGDE
jgi:signal transduction histidine kinase